MHANHHNETNTRFAVCATYGITHYVNELQKCYVQCRTRSPWPARPSGTLEGTSALSGLRVSGISRQAGDGASLLVVSRDCSATPPAARAAFGGRGTTEDELNSRAAPNWATRTIGHGRP